MEAYEIAKLGDLICLLVSLGCMYMLVSAPETDVIKKKDEYLPIVVIGLIAELGWVYFILAKINMRFTSWFMEITNYELLILLHIS